MDIKLLLMDKIREADRPGANELLDSWIKENGYENVLMEVLDPVLVLIGEEWRSTESFTLAQAYVAAKIAEDVMYKIAENKESISKIKTFKGEAVIGNIEEDFHSLGRKMVATFLRTEGWTVHDLGNDVIAKDFVDKAVETGARVIGVSAMMMTNARNILKVRHEIDARGLSGRIKLAVGGAIFRVCPTLASEVGADGTAPHALGAAKLFDELMEKSLKEFPEA